MVEFDSAKFAESVKINYDDLDVSLVDQSEKYDEYAELHYAAHRQAADLRNVRDQVQAKLDAKIRAFHNPPESVDPKAPKPVKLTEAQITAKIEADPEYTKALTESQKADSILVRYNNALEALKHRKEMLVSLAIRG